MAMLCSALLQRAPAVASRHGLPQPDCQTRPPSAQEYNRAASARSPASGRAEGHRQGLESGLCLAGAIFTVTVELCMPTLGLNHYNLRAPRLLMEELRSFYCDVVGLIHGARPPFGSFGYWLYAGGQPILHLSEARPGEPPGTGAVSTFDHAAFSCCGRTDFERKLTGLGIAFTTARVPGTTQVQLFIRDPAGNGVELNFATEDA